MLQKHYMHYINIPVSIISPLLLMIIANAKTNRCYKDGQ